MTCRALSGADIFPFSFFDAFAFRYNSDTPFVRRRYGSIVAPEDRYTDHALTLGKR